MGVIKLNNITSDSVGIVVELPPDYEIPERDVSVHSLPGRNGDVVLDNHRYKNIDREYSIAIGEVKGDFNKLSLKISNWINSSIGYVRFEDSYLPEVFMIGTITEASKIVNILQQAGRTTLKINRKPQRFLKSGERAISISRPTTLYNPTQYNALPLIKVRGANKGTISIGGIGVTIGKITDGMIIDSEVEDVSKDTTNLNNDVKMATIFPILKPGNINISFSGGITSIEIIPRWWIL